MEWRVFLGKFYRPTGVSQSTLWPNYQNGQLCGITRAVARDLILTIGRTQHLAVKPEAEQMEAKLAALLGVWGTVGDFL